MTYLKCCFYRVWTREKHGYWPADIATTSIFRSKYMQLNPKDGVKRNN